MKLLEETKVDLKDNGKTIDYNIEFNHEEVEAFMEYVGRISAGRITLQVTTEMQKVEEEIQRYLEKCFEDKHYLDMHQVSKNKVIIDILENVKRRYEND